MVYSRGSIFVKPHHREHAVADFVDPKIPVGASAYQKPHWFNASPYHKPHFGFGDLSSSMSNLLNKQRQAPGLEKRSMPKAKTMG
mgnify:CR=1 FL=1